MVSVKDRLSYLHIGNHRALPIWEIIAVLNVEQGIRPDTMELIEQAEADRHLYRAGAKDTIRSLVICTNGVYQSPLSATTLYKRMLNQSWEEKNE